jgi:hypothetical protein
MRLQVVCSWGLRPGPKREALRIGGETARVAAGLGEASYSWAGLGEASYSCGSVR